VSERLCEEGYRGGYTIVRWAVPDLRLKGREVFDPLVHRHGETQVDFGEAVVKPAGRLRKVAFFVMALPRSDAFIERPNERGLVEGTVKFARLNFLVPIPQVRDLVELNTYPLGRSGEDLDRRLRGHSANRGVLLEEERDALLPLPAGPFDACHKESTTASALSLARFDDNDYSVPARYAHHLIVVRASCPHEDWRATTFSLDGRQHLRHEVVASTDVTAYRALLAPGGTS
jgi:hypothetical protein